MLLISIIRINYLSSCCFCFHIQALQGIFFLPILKGYFYVISTDWLKGILLRNFDWLAPHLFNSVFLIYCRTLKVNAFFRLLKTEKSPDYTFRRDKLEVTVNSPLAKTCMIRADTKCTVYAVHRTVQSDYTVYRVSSIKKKISWKFRIFFREIRTNIFAFFASYVLRKNAKFRDKVCEIRTKMFTFFGFSRNVSLAGHPIV